jgi:selenocysteine lyase/cysteine desulfurase
LEPSERLPIVSFAVDGITAADVAARLWDDYEIAVRAGYHCAPLMHRALGTEKTGLVRFSFSYFNTMDEVDRCVFALREIIGDV